MVGLIPAAFRRNFALAMCVPSEAGGTKEAE